MDYELEIKSIYENTNKQFRLWSKSNDLQFRNAACSETLGRYGQDRASKLGDPFGFSILWTPIIKNPTFLFCGLCVTSFGTILDNQKYLKGNIPSKNIYENSNHDFGKNIETVFKQNNSLDLFKNCVGLNLWHFQYVGSPPKNVYANEVREYCENNTLKIINLIKPHYIISLHNIVYPKLNKSFKNVKMLTHPTFQNGYKFNEQMSNILKSIKH